MKIFAFLCSFLLASSASVAWADSFVVHTSDYEAQDSTPPQIAHEPVTYAPRNSNLALTAVITDKSGIFGPTVSYRNAGSGDKWRIVDMQPVGNEPDTFKAVIDGAYFPQDIEYFVEAYDKNGNGPTRVGSAESPLKVVATVPLADPGASVGERKFPVEPVVLAAAGAVLTSIGAALWFSAESTIAELDAKYAEGQGRPLDDFTATQSAIGRSRVGSGLMIAGGAAIAGGIVWFLVPQSDGAEFGAAGSF